MVDAQVIIQSENRNLYGQVSIFYDKVPAKVLSNDISWKIIQAIQEKPKYAREIAKELSLNEQSVYYHIKQLLSCGIINVVEEQNIRGANAKKVLLSKDGVAILFKQHEMEFSRAHNFHDKLCLFFNEFNKDNSFDGYIVVGSPEPHGPFRAVARDGHYAVQLSYFLGKCTSSPKSFMIRLDTDIKAERLYNENLILIGGPITNIITSEINQYLQVKFVEPNYWVGLIDEEGKVYNGETEAMISKIKNPYNNSKSIIVIAGIRHVGTKSAIIGLTEFSEVTLKSYMGQPKFTLITKGFDQDGDGKIDHTETLKSYSNL